MHNHYTKVEVHVFGLLDSLWSELNACFGCSFSGNHLNCGENSSNSCESNVADHGKQISAFCIFVLLLLLIF